MTHEDKKVIFDSLELAAFQYAKMTLVNAEMCKLKPSEIAFGALSNACNYLKELHQSKTTIHYADTINDVDVLKQIIGFFQVLFQKSVFKSIDIDSVEDKVCTHLKTFTLEYSQ